MHASTFVRQGKVRDIYDLGDCFLMVATDRISAFDWILPTEIPDKGRVLTQLSKFWFELLRVPHHLITTELEGYALPAELDARWLAGRSMVVKKCKVVPIECVVRGYLVGSGWKDYRATGRLSGIELPKGLVNCQRFPEPLFTPATKATSGHDENISFEKMCQDVGRDVAETLRRRSLDIYSRAAACRAARDHPGRHKIRVRMVGR